MKLAEIFSGTKSDHRPRCGTPRCTGGARNQWPDSPAYHSVKGLLLDRLERGLLGDESRIRDDGRALVGDVLDNGCLEPRASEPDIVGSDLHLRSDRNETAPVIVGSSPKAGHWNLG
ncbi:uncharacterized protein A4U43_C04F7990 [Asparagus officinalis]|uniref:Uncharacterized protein n=1 Tax=Asparagus officinalis TaxID=4686 RepID=A0A5P1EZS6_ASPOF|nr:uncharacterized protein A4U43_C04F7990 [Asparagus officinalis]